MKKVLLGFMLVLMLGVFGFGAKGKIAPLSWGLWGDVNVQSGVGAHGYDVVSYHAAGLPTVGLEQYSSEFAGATWHFSEQKNKKIFEADPGNYIPRYGGFCAFAVYKNVTADVNPEIWHIENGSLYLFASETAKQSWVAEISQNSIAVTDRNWSSR